jgi:hypothetical protein
MILVVRVYGRVDTRWVDLRERTTTRVPNVRFTVAPEFILSHTVAGGGVKESAAGGDMISSRPAAKWVVVK